MRTSRKYLFTSLILLGALVGALALFGCSSEKATTAPNRATTSAVTGTEHYVRGEDGLVYKVRVTIGTISVVCVCDYPSGFMGPLPDGHCRADEPSYPRDYVAPANKAEANAIRQWNADNDGVVLHH